MTPEELDQILGRLDMRHVDLAILGDVTTRCVREWSSGRRPIPRPIAILLRAIDRGHIKEPWLVRQIKAS